MTPAEWKPIDVRGKLPTSGESDYGKRPLGTITGVTIHYTAGPTSQTVYAVAAYQTSEAARGQTGAGVPFPGLAYTMFVEGDGKGYLAHDLGVRTWHSGAVISGQARNLTHVGICYAGNLAPTPAQKATMKECIAWVERTLGRTLTLEGHGDAYSTSCPGPRWDEWKDELR